LARFGWDDIESAFESCDTGGAGINAGEVIYSFMQGFYEKHLANTYRDAKRRADDITELTLHVAGFESVESFLSEVALMTNLDAEIEKEGMHGSGSDALRLSTVHQAKGLEWPAVIVLWMTEGMFPSARSLKESGEGDAEERRLFYVAVTRAKDELCMCVPELRRKRDGTVTYCVPSRFISEVPRGLVDEHMVGFI
jgi:DNA helicase-2/ATP-dependent DNA helicase PcrA